MPLAHLFCVLQKTDVPIFFLYYPLADIRLLSLGLLKVIVKKKKRKEIKCLKASLKNCNPYEILV